MTKVELIKNIEEKLGEDFTKKQIEAVLVANGVVAQEGLVAGDEVPVVGLGKVKTKDVAERQVPINPRDREAGMKVAPAHKAPKFAFSGHIKEIVE
jgi:nucleoid DNA-binding protein